MNLSGLTRPGTLIVLVVVLVLLFGAKRLPDAARSLGRSMRILKAETKDLVNDGRDNADDDLDEKADAQAGRQPLPRDTRADTGQRNQPPTRGEPVTGEVVDPPQRTRDI